MENDNHATILVLLGELKREVQGVNNRLDKLNGAVAKHADKFADQAVINTQVTITQQQMIKDFQEFKDDARDKEHTADQDRRSIKSFWYERIVYAIIFLGLLVLAKLGILNIK